MYGPPRHHWCSGSRRPDWFGAAPRDRAPLHAASAPPPSPHSVPAPSPAARLSLDAPPGCPYVALVSPLGAIGPGTHLEYRAKPHTTINVSRWVPSGRFTLGDRARWSANLARNRSKLTGSLCLSRACSLSEMHHYRRRNGDVVSFDVPPANSPPPPRHYPPRRQVKIR